MTSAYGRKQTFGLSLNRCSLTSALEKIADIRVLELRARVNGRNRLPFQPVDATHALLLSAGVLIPRAVPTGDKQAIEGSPEARPLDYSAPACFQRSHNYAFYSDVKPRRLLQLISIRVIFKRFS